MDIVLANLAPQKSYMNSGSLESRITTLHFPMGLGIIAAVLKEAGLQFTAYDSYVNGTTEGFLKMIEQKRPDAILLSGFLGSYFYRFVKDVSRKIKLLNEYAIIIIGGPMASSIPELLISKTSIDFVVKGEGECTIIELLDAINRNKSLATVKGIYYKDISNRVVFTGERERINNLDESPFPYYNAFPIDAYVSYLNETNRCWEISASRGCYARCNFCKLTFGQKIKSHSYQSVVDHMIYVSEEYCVNKFNFVDDNFLNNPKGIDEFVAILRNLSQKFKWRFQGRADRISPEMVGKMVEVGLFDISFGVESGSQKMLNRYGKKLDIKKTLTNLKTIKSMVRIHATFIVGGPEENWDTVEETKRFISKLKLNNTGVGILTLFPGTIFYDETKKNGLINDDEEYCMNLGPVYDRPYVNISDMSDDDLIKARDMLVETAAEFGSYM